MSAVMKLSFIMINAAAGHNCPGQGGTGRSDERLVLEKLRGTGTGCYDGKFQG